MSISDFPVKSKAWSTPGKVSIVVHVYSNRIFILLSELDAGSAGTLVEFRQETSANQEQSSSSFEGGDSQPTNIVYDIRVLFGVEKPETLLVARVLGSKIHKSGLFPEIPILFGLGLKRFDKPLIEETAESLLNHLKSIQ